MKQMSQEDAILRLLVAARGCEVPLPEILRAQGGRKIIALHTARITGLRHRGYDIRCRAEWVRGQKHTFYRLVK